MVIKLNKSEGECMPIILKGAGQWQAGLGDLFIAIPLQYGVHVFNFTRSTARSPVFQDRVVNAAQGEPLPAGRQVEPFGLSFSTGSRP